MNERLSLTTDGVEMIDYPESTKRQVVQAAKAWRRFLALDTATKEAFATDSLQSGTGYEHKGDGQRESRDIKENFDITQASLDELASKAASGAAGEFIAQAGTLFDAVGQMIVRYGEHVETTYGIDGFAAEATASAQSAFIRFLHYPPVPAGTLIGEPHVDHSGFTFHLYESTDGCERLTYNKQSWLPMPVASQAAAAFPSMQTQLFSHGELRGLCHRIVANETTSQIGRIAIVCFVPLIHMPSYDRRSHGRLQEFTPGFNYDMSNNEFNELFTSDR